MDPAQHEALTLTGCAWCAEAEAALAPAARGDIDWIRDEVKRDQATLYRVAGVAQGWLVLRIDPGPELVIVAAAGRNARPVIRHLVDLASRRGWGVRTHIQRPGLERMYAAAGFYRAEIVMRRDHGRSQ